MNPYKTADVIVDALADMRNTTGTFAAAINMKLAEDFLIIRMFEVVYALIDAWATRGKYFDFDSDNPKMKAIYKWSHEARRLEIDWHE